uniref:Tyrosine-protein kinase ephrin type A/B receptor-like domain-containing protein n=1 Tax=Chromera velia CCMP2878 TaxID=1169474 RepID=A0A0G4FM78_9ALVE|eukprot:Cvel_3516.t1-p1 / transcript=Cvel_3516.t1 / gene=Cvel_3516 / organism=Chromera_velia_CCMP2878 / gene_product=hypothetical protein / transcript_product=hypothetical protein / location=Cvel_scaffold142:113559-118954(+) / protein_length=376 / sequence_SO=supercontig / SO=protein_coding / is_pseudo=false
MGVMGKPLLSSLWLSFLCLLPFLREIGSVCYLTGDDCAACWKTIVSTSTTTLDTCPTGLALAWIDEPLDELTTDDTDSAAYRFTVDTTTYPTYQPSGSDISHANIHSCFTSVGAWSCTACPAGQYRGSSDDASECLRCPLGSYSESTGASACTSCPSTKTTGGLGSLKSSDCTCDTEEYLDHKNDVCVSCETLTHLTCEGGDALPLSAPGFWTELVETPSEFSTPRSFKCGTPSACPGGHFDQTLFSSTDSDTESAASSASTSSSNSTAIAQCNGQRVGLMCESCPAGMFKTSDDCRECQGGSVSWPLIVAIIGSILLMVGFYYGINGSYTARYSPVSGLIASMSICFLFAQIRKAGRQGRAGQGRAGQVGWMVSR